MLGEESTARDAVFLEGIKGGFDEEAIRVIPEHAKFKPGISQGSAFWSGCQCGLGLIRVGDT